MAEGVSREELERLTKALENLAAFVLEGFQHLQPKPTENRTLRRDQPDIGVDGFNNQRGIDRRTLSLHRRRSGKSTTNASISTQHQYQQNHPRVEHLNSTIMSMKQITPMSLVTIAYAWSYRRLTVKCTTRTS